MVPGCPDNDRLAAFVGRELTEPERTVIESHLEICVACDEAMSLLVSAFREAQDPPRDPGTGSLPSRGSTVGRYRIVGFAGSGAMGAVFSAFDPELQRRVALKILHASVGAVDSERARFSSEAQSVAKIRHPNVIAVHDVGVHNESPFFAMEFVEGETLGRWLRQRRTATEVLDVFLAAGRGLWAAHKSGLVHRDFKPDNVLIGKDGDIKVIDFGLARARAASSFEEDSGTTTESLVRTRAGTLVGTPSYMAPEQLRAEPSDARSDQFAFCLALYEGLCGAAAFEGRSLDELRENVGMSRLTWERAADPTRTGRVSRRTRSALERGLSFDPADRFDSMAELLRRLRPRRPRWLEASGVLLGAGGLAALLSTQDTEDPARACPPSEAQMAGIWDEPTRSKFLEAVGPEQRASRWMSQKLDAYAQSWVKAHDDTCAATMVRQERSIQTMERRMACLERGRGRLESLVRLALENPVPALERAPQLIASLDPASRCVDGDPEDLPAPVDSPEVRAATRALGEAQTLLAVARPREALEKLDSIGDVLRSDMPALERTMLSLRGRSWFSLGDYDKGESLLRDALTSALEARDFGMAAEVSTRLVCFHAGAGSFDAGLAHATTALGFVDDIVDRAVASRVYRCVGSLAHMRGELDEADQWFRRGLAELEQLPQADPIDISDLASAIALLESQQGNPKTALQRQSEALSAVEEALGPGHPWTLRLRTRVAIDLMKLGRLEEAEAEASRAVELWSLRTAGRPASAANARIMLAHILYTGEKLGEAKVEYERGIEGLLESVGPDDRKTLSAQVSLAGLLHSQGAYDDALSIYAEVLERKRRVLGEAHHTVLQTELSIVATKHSAGRFSETVAPLETLVVTCDSAEKADPERCVRGNRLLGVALLQARQDWRQATAALESARRCLERLPHKPPGLEATLDDLKTQIDVTRRGSTRGGGRR